MDNDLQVTEEQIDEELCVQVWQCNDADVEAIANDPSSPSNKEVLNALSIIHQQLIHQGGDLNTFTSLEREMMENISANLKQQTLEKFFKATE